MFVNPNVVTFSRQFNDQHAVDVALRRAAADIQYHDAAAAFDRDDFGEAIDQLILAMHSRYDIEQPWARRLIRRKLSTITLLRHDIERLKAEKQALQTALDDKQRLLNTLALEYIRLAEQSLEMDEPKSAVANYDKALSLNPSCIDAYVGKARVLLSQRRLQRALKTINQALDVLPTHFKSLYTRGKIHFTMRSLDLACADLDRCTSMKPDNISAHLLFGDILSAMGDEGAAAVQYAIAERLKQRLRD